MLVHRWYSCDPTKPSGMRSTPGIEFFADGRWARSLDNGPASTTKGLGRSSLGGVATAEEGGSGDVSMERVSTTTDPPPAVKTARPRNASDPMDTVWLRALGARSALECGGKRQRHAAFGMLCGRAPRCGPGALHADESGVALTLATALQGAPRSVFAQQDCVNRTTRQPWASAIFFAKSLLLGTGGGLRSLRG